MEGTGPEAVKRPRLDSYSGPVSAHRIQQQAPEPSSHSYPGHALPPPSAYNQHLPLSPYHDPVSEHRSLPEPPHHVSFTQSHSGYTTPIRDIRSFPPEQTYSRNGSASAPTRSPDDIQQLAPLRPLNTASANESYHYPQHTHPETTRGPSGYITHDGLPNGTLQSLAMTNHNEPISAPPFPGPPGSIPNTPMGNGTSIHGGGGQFNPPPITTWMPRPTRKHTRATQACDTCRTRKAKCDEGKPICGYCQESGLPCNYKEVAPAKADRAQKEIMDRLKASEEKIDRLQATLERFIATGHGLQSFESEPKDREPDLMSIPQHVDSRSPERKPDRESDGTSRQSSEFEQEQHISRQVMAQPSPPVRSPLELPFSIVEIDHTTAAHKLLRWPSIRNLLRQRPVKEDYVMQLEERKGVLRIYGRGQGNESLDESQTLPSSPATSSSSGRSDELIRYQAPVPLGLWGTGVFASPTPPDAKSWGKEHPGGLDANGSLKMDNQTMYRLHQSYLNNFHIMHPFLDKKMLSRMFERLMRWKSSAVPSSRASPFISHGHIADTFRDSPPGFTSANKRKFSGGPSIGSPSDAGAGANQPLERRISTAIVLLVMALGKISEHTEPLPGPVPDNPKQTPMSAPRSYSPLSHESPPSVKPSPASSSTSAYTTRSPMSDIRGHPWSRGPSEEHPSSQNAPKPDKNVDVIPGLAYFAHATDILGNQHGGHDLAHVQANLLAGLYMGQLACTFESLSWISSACLICHHIVRDPTLKRERDEARKDSIRFAYYTCLQLESDLLAELDLQSIRIDRPEHQDFVAYPKGVTEDVTDLGNLNDPGAKVLAYYSSQIYLRRMLNKIQLALYPTGASHSRIPLSIRDECQEMLTNWRRVLPPEMRWSDDDGPSEDINEARLRAKYYGALYIIHRPFLYYALHSPDFVNASDMSEGEEEDFRRMEREPGAMPPPALTAHDRAEIMRSAALCVKAASQSTVAFDGICQKRRLVVTNIFGTAHAQFGNMLVLAATQRSHLSKLVEKHKIVGLLERTIDFLRRLKQISETLWEDARILECVAQVVRNDGMPSSSFSSSTG